MLAAAWSHCRQAEHKGCAQTGAAAVPGCAHTADFPLPSLPHPGTIQHYLPGPDTLFPDYLVVVVVGNEKEKCLFFLSNVEHETLWTANVYGHRENEKKQALV